MAAKYKKEKGKCEDCGIANSLEAAHIKGKGRTFIIANILSEFVEDDMIKIELNEFEQKFIESHLPIELTIRVLCKECHRKYDKVVNEEKSTNKKASIVEEGIIIENMIKNQMNKSKAMQIAASRNLTSPTNSNTIFSNII